MLFIGHRPETHRQWQRLLEKAKGFALGCPAMGAEVLEETEMEPFVCEVESFAIGKAKDIPKIQEMHRDLCESVW